METGACRPEDKSPPPTRNYEFYTLPQPAAGRIFPALVRTSSTK